MLFRYVFGSPPAEVQASGAKHGVPASLDPGQFNRHNVMIPNWSEVQAHLTPFPLLRHALPDICAETREQFGPDAELSLELYRDPEFDDCYLTLYVRMNKYDGQVMAKIHAVRSKFADRLSAINGYLLVTTDFRRPRGENAV
jgi:hypothetical protein